MFNAFTNVLTAVLIQTGFGSLNASVSIAFAFSACCLYYHVLVYFYCGRYPRKTVEKKNNTYWSSFSDFTVHSWWLPPLFLAMGVWAGYPGWILCCCIREIRGGGRRERQGRSRKVLEHVFPRHASRD